MSNVCPNQCKRNSVLISVREEVRIKHKKNLKLFIDYSEAIDNVPEQLKDYNPTKKKIVNSV